MGITVNAILLEISAHPSVIKSIDVMALQLRRKLVGGFRTNAG